jgi:hypothetical protein
MHIAKSMYMGGIIVYADDDFLNYSSYLELGLLCLGCNNDIYLREGQVNKRHFAHRKAISEEEKQCEYRVNSILRGLGGNFTEIARNQRRDIFQAYLVQFIASSHQDFYKKIKNENISANFELFVEKCTSFYHKLESDFVAHCRRTKNMNIPTGEVANNLIAGEIFSYLGCESSKEILKKICLYSSLKLKEEEESEIIKNEDIAIERALDILKSVILNTSWDMLSKPMPKSQISRELEYRLRKPASSNLKEGPFEKNCKINDNRYDSDEKSQKKARGTRGGNRGQKKKEEKREARKQMEVLRKNSLDSIREEVLESLRQEQGITKENFEELREGFKEAEIEKIHTEIIERYQDLLEKGYPITCPDRGKTISTNFPQHVKKHYEPMIDAMIRKTRGFESYVEKLALEELKHRGLF